MRQKIDLYINGRKADISSQSFILFNYTRESLDNPAIVKNSYSQNITLAGTPNNDAIFGGLDRLDHTQAVGGAFRTLAKMPFQIINERNEVLESGYIKLNNITKQGRGEHSFDVSLYGGLGGFFYTMMYKETGDKKTLADLSFQEQTETININKDTIAAAWDYLDTGSGDALWGLINFAPAYNGYPTGKFGKNKAVCKPFSAYMGYPNLYNSKDGYTAKQGANGAILLEMQNEHTEWEMQDLRSYLQRPVISIKGLLNALQRSENTGDYTFKVDALWIASNIWYEKGWMTLPMLNIERNDVTAFPFSSIFEGTASPAEYLIGLAKMFGLVFITDAATKTITLTSRDLFYSTGEDVVNLAERIDEQSIKVGVYPMDAKFYIWDAETYGEFTKVYEGKYGRKYGSAWVNTNYDFNADQKRVLDGIPYKGAADVLESSINFQVFGGDTNSQGGRRDYMFKFAFTEQVSWKLYGTDASGKEITQDFTPSQGWLVPYTYSGAAQVYNDFFPKVQLHAEDNKAEDGSGVLLFFNGMVDTPKFTMGDVVMAEVQFHLSDDCEEMLLLNGGEPCWDVSRDGASDNIRNISSLPSFRRWHYNSAYYMDASFDFGDVRETAVDGVYEDGKGLYEGFWKAYIADRYDQDTRLMTCKVNLKGYKVDEGLLRKFWYYDGAIWVLNKISNHSLTTYDLTECEFVKVQDMENYKDNQVI